VGYTVKTDVFEGPFDLLLHLVSRQKLDVNAISISQVADQYLEHIDRMADLDLDVASEFLVLAATLLEIKAASLLPRQEAYIGDELDDLSPEEARDLLVARLIAYKQFKNAAGEISARNQQLTLHALGLICADLEHKREVFLLEAEHVASMPISLELHAESVRRQVSRSKRASFSELVGRDATPEVIVVTFLAILELYKRGLVDIVQDATFGDIVVIHLSPEQAAERGIMLEDLHE
jgi:segregation and condensation protein A